MPGRTHLQQALPITFGYKCAIWLSMMERHAERLRELKPRVLVAQFGGAAGTLASLGDRGLDVRREYARELKLGDPPITWHVARDAVAETINFLALVTGSLGKIGFDIMLMMMTELGEAFEPFADHRGASSTMPQKRNPISSEILVANAKAVRQHAGLVLDAMIQDFERATGPWHVEWIAVPEAFMLTAGSLAQAKFMLEGLVVDEARMRRNLDMTRGLIVAEAVMMGLAPHLGRQQAHDVVYEACREALAQNGSLFDVLAANTVVSAALPADQAARAVRSGQLSWLGTRHDGRDCRPASRPVGYSHERSRWNSGHLHARRHLARALFQGRAICPRMWPRATACCLPRWARPIRARSTGSAAPTRSPARSRSCRSRRGPASMSITCSRRSISASRSSTPIRPAATCWRASRPSRSRPG